MAGNLLLTSCDSLVNRFAFFPNTVDGIPAGRLPYPVTEIFIETVDSLKLQAYFAPYRESGQILIYFHGNAGNLSHRLTDILQIHRFGINVLALSYRGFGQSDGKPSEEGIYLDGKAAYQYAIDVLGFRPRDVILFGRSIGTAVAVHTAQDLNVGGLILVSPLTTGKAHAAYHGFGPLALLAGRSFDNAGRMHRIKCPLLVIHGTKDNVIPLSMGRELYHLAPVDKQFLEVPAAGHNDLASVGGKVYWEGIQRFIERVTS